MSSYLTFVHTLSPLHAGTGQGSGVIDLPIAREKATGLPYLPGSSLKGALRTSCDEEIAIGGNKTVKRNQLFGGEETDGTPTPAGTIQISDQRLLLLPVRSLAGTFAWVTSPYVLRRLVRDMVELGLERLKVPTITDLQRASVVSDGPQASQASIAGHQAASCQLFATEKRIYLEDLDLLAAEEGTVRAWADWLGRQLFQENDWRDILSARLCVVHDDVFSFLLKTATEVIARNRLEEASKTVKKGGLWYEEALPTESVLSGLALATPRPKPANGREGLKAEDITQAFETLTRKNLQLGGKSTVGRGQCRIRIVAERRVNHANA